MLLFLLQFFFLVSSLAGAAADVESRTLQVAYSSSPKTLRVAALCVTPSNAAGTPTGDQATPVLLLHGASFNAHTWMELGTLSALSGLVLETRTQEPGMPRNVCAVDIPSTLTSSGDFIVGILDALAWKTAFLVAPSASGRLLWPFLLSEASYRRVAGVVSVAAVGFDAYAERLGMSSAAGSTPVLLVWGERCVFMRMDVTFHASLTHDVLMQGQS